LAVLDDVLSGLDLVTEELVFQRVFGATGLFRQTNTIVILATHSGNTPFFKQRGDLLFICFLVKRLPLADLLLAMDETGRVVEQGTFKELNAAGNYIQSLQVKLLEEQGHTADSDESTAGSTNESMTSIPAATATTDQARKTGDWDTYKYYTRALGLWPMALFVGLVTIFEGFWGLTSMFDIYCLLSVHLGIAKRMQAPGLSGGVQVMTIVVARLWDTGWGFLLYSA
jgi:ATP-binding cassette, subfamily C (CFTR/MRP), member 1